VDAERRCQTDSIGAAPRRITALVSSNPLVSVLVTSYNREAFIAEAIESVLAQTFTDFELIVSDDASSDNTAAIARGFARRDARVRVSVNERNLSDYPNRKRAACLARGQFLKYHDSDDVMYPHCLDVMVGALLAEPRAAVALSASHAWSGGKSPMLLTPSLAYEREYLGTGLFQLGPAAALFRTEAFRELGGFPEMPHCSDQLFWIHALTRVNVLLVPGDLFYYRIHPGQEIAKPANDLAQAKALAEAWRVLNSEQCPLRGDVLDRARRNFAFTRAREIYRSLKQRKFSTAAATWRHCGLSSGDWARYLRPARRSTTAGTPPSV
jgi:glycosyltransferase involved in cell wall biosynthesis